MRVVRLGMLAGTVLALLTLGACSTHDTVVLQRAAGPGPRVLVVVAHPDDETGFVGTLHKTATLLDGRCDQVVITNGEGGFKYSTLAERLYGSELTDESIGRRDLPAIRRQEMLDAGRVIGLSQVHFLGAQDHRYTTDRQEVLGPSSPWNLPAIRARLRQILWEGDYDFVLVHWPSPRTHAHHQAATILALEAVAEMEMLDRPAVLAGFTSRPDAEPREVVTIPELPITEIRDDAGPYHFDRSQRFGFMDRLDYHIVVNWSIACHKSQGRHQRGMQGRSLESFRLFRMGPPGAAGRAEAWFEALQQPQYPGRTYEGGGAATRGAPQPPAQPTATGQPESTG